MLATLVEFLLRDNLKIEAGVLASAQVRWEFHRHDQWEDVNYFGLVLAVPVSVFAFIKDQVPQIQDAFLDRIQTIIRAVPDEHTESVLLVPQMASDPDWRTKTFAYLAGQGVNNQGKVRSDNIAPYNHKGLLFRSNQEINLFEAFRAAGLSFAPLPVFIRGGEEYRRIEPDFVVIKEGMMLVIEVDGDTYHKETPAEAQNRTMMLENEGARIIHVPASDCDTPEKAAVITRRVLATFAKIKAAGR